MNNIEIALKGIKIASNLLNITEPSIYFVSSDELPNKEVTAVFRHKNYEVIFNEDWLAEVPWIEVMVTCFHETRHSYQAYSVKNRINESKETLTKWNNDFYFVKKTQLIMRSEEHTSELQSRPHL